MNNLTLFLLGLVLINVPSCFSECFSELLTPAYPCCKGNRVVYTDENGDWGVENNKWCGISEGPFDDIDDSCFSIPLGYKCCEKCKVVFTDDSGDWGVEKNRWCGIKYSCASPVEIEETTVPIETEETTVSVETEKTTVSVETEETTVSVETEETTIPVEIEEPVPVEIKEPQDFDFTFLKMENNKENMLYSPLSIKYALKMLEEGAANNTLAEIKKVLNNSTLSKYENIDSILSLANGLFIRNEYFVNVKREYILKLKEDYDAEIIGDEFDDAENVNQWIEQKTLGIIKDMLTDDMFQDETTLMLLINALAIDMEWADQFNFGDTWGVPFYKDDGEKMTATTMYQEFSDNKLKYYVNDDVTAITMDLKEFSGTQFEFMAVMPNENLSGFVDRVSNDQINDIINKLKYASEVRDGVILEIPKFKFNYDLNLKGDLMNLGIQDAFDNYKADFSKMTTIKYTDEKLYVSDALHKADIEFTEKGVKAAAVTIIRMNAPTSTGMDEPTHPLVIKINKPFMFLIRNKNTKDIWFVGTVYEPNSWENDRDEY